MYKYEICTHPELFKDIKYQDISYRMVISRMMMKQHNILTNDEVRSILIECRDFIQQTINHLDVSHLIHKSHFLEMYKFITANNDYGIVFIDRTNGSFPLILYQEDNILLNRRVGMLRAIESILQNYEKIQAAMLNNTWDSEIVKKLNEIFFPSNVLN